MLLKFISRIDESKSSESIKDRYSDYIEEHKSNVIKAYNWLRENCLDLFDKIDEKEFLEQLEEHDDSKYSMEEFEPYANKWFGDGKKTPEYEAAWEHHWKNNKHHPEYWGGKDMPAPFILEMICDWLSFGIKNDNPREIIDYYNSKAKNDSEKNLSDNTKKYIETCLEAIDAATAEQI